MGVSIDPDPVPSGSQVERLASRRWIDSLAPLRPSQRVEGNTLHLQTRAAAPATADPPSGDKVLRPAAA